MNFTTYLLIASVFFYAIYDIAAAMLGGREATISYDVLNAAQAHPVIPLAVGVILGHLFWPQH
jgi:hypothetical protein